MKKPLVQMKNALREFHHNEEGDALQTVMIIAVAAMVVAVIIIFGNDIVKWARGLIDKMKGTPIADGG